MTQGRLALLGNTPADRLMGGALEDTLTGYEGADTLQGGAGNDHLDGGDHDDRLEGGEGNDTFDAGTGADILIGGAGDDTLDGGDGVDRAVYSGNKDEYTIAEGHGFITVSGPDGTDTLRNVNRIQFADEVVDVVVKGIILVGTDAPEVVEGTEFEDSLGGGLGNDTLSGSNGEDIIDGGGDNDILNGGSDADSVSGGAGNDVLDGGTGADTLIGGAGDDVYRVDSVGDVVSEVPLTAGMALFAALAPTATSSGRDTVQASINYTLGSGIEALVLKGTATVGIGNSLNNSLAGNSGANTINGGYGNDILKGGTGEDVFLFSTKLSTAANRDIIVDFSVSDDSLYLDNAIFTMLGSGSMSSPRKVSSSYFTVGSAAKDKNDHLIYNKATGVLSYDADGSGLGRAVEVAKLSKGLAMTYSDFCIV